MALGTAAAACCDARYSSSSAQHHAWVWQLCGRAIWVILGKSLLKIPRHGMDKTLTCWSRERVRKLLNLVLSFLQTS